MTLEKLYKFMVKNKILEAESNGVKLKLHPSALTPKMSKKEKNEWDKKVEEATKDLEGESLATWSV